MDSGLALAREFYPRVSTVLRDMGLTKPYPEIAAVEWGRARGRAVHRAIELYEDGILDETNLHPDVAGPFEGYKKFKHECHYTPEAWEEAVYHDVLRFRGTLDSRGTCGVRRMLVDFKCSKQPDLQAAAYQLAAYGLCNDNSVMAPIVVQLLDGSYKVHHVYSEDAITIFSGAVRLWHVVHGGGKLTMGTKPL